MPHHIPVLQVSVNDVIARDGFNWLVREIVHDADPTVIGFRVRRCDDGRHDRVISYWCDRSRVDTVDNCIISTKRKESIMSAMPEYLQSFARMRPVPRQFTLSVLAGVLLVIGLLTGLSNSPQQTSWTPEPLPGSAATIPLDMDISERCSNVPDHIKAGKPAYACITREDVAYNGRFAGRYVARCHNVPSVYRANRPSDACMARAAMFYNHRFAGRYAVAPIDVALISFTVAGWQRVTTDHRLYGQTVDLFRSDDSARVVRHCGRYPWVLFGDTTTIAIPTCHVNHWRIGTS